MFNNKHVYILAHSAELVFVLCWPHHNQPPNLKDYKIELWTDSCLIYRLWLLWEFDAWNYY